VVLAAGTLAQTTYSAIWFGVAVMAPALRDRFHLSLGQTGLLISGSLLGSGLSLIPWGLAADRLGERAVLASGLGACGAALVAAAAPTRFWPLMALLVLAGLAGASVQSASGRAVTHWFGPGERGLALGIRQTAIPLSGFAVALALPRVVDAGGVRWGFATLGGACLVGAAAGGLLLREPPPRGLPAGSREAAPLRDRRLWTLSVGSGLVVAPQLCVGGFTVLYLHERRGVSAGAAAAVLALMQLLAIGGRIGAGRWSDLRGSRVGPLRSIALAAAVLVEAMAALLDERLAVVVPVLVVAGVLSMSWNALSFAAAVELAGPARSGVAIGLQQTLLNVPSAAYPALFGVLVGATSWRVGFALIALFPLAGRRVLKPLTVVGSTEPRRTG
jgi:sugar phosphate permease